MDIATDRLERYLGDELGACRPEDVDRRLDELATLESRLERPAVDSELAVLSALANETRYRLVRALVAADDELCVCELTPLVDVSESGLSHALSRLADAGLVDGRKDGRWRKYRATDRATTLVAALDDSVDTGGGVDE